MTDDNRFFRFMPGKRELVIAGRTFRLPASRPLRITAGILLVVGGLFGFLPVLGFWMIPLGFLVLSQDIAIVRRWRRALSVRFERWRHRKRRKMRR